MAITTIFYCNSQCYANITYLLIYEIPFLKFIFSLFGKVFPLTTPQSKSCRCPPAGQQGLPTVLPCQSHTFPLHISQSTQFSLQKQSHNCGYAPLGCHVLLILPRIVFPQSGARQSAPSPPNCPLSFCF